jgi:uncharacterized protein
MQLRDGAIVFSATDLTNFLECEHLTAQELEAARAGTRPPRRDDPQVEVLRRRGAEHERMHLHRIIDSGANLVEIPRAEHASVDEYGRLEASTLAAMRQGADYIYQGCFFDGRWFGQADFLRRVDAPSELGAWSYEVEDAKLARRVRVAALMQLADYSRHVQRLQGREPRLVHVVLGTGGVESLPLTDVTAYYRAARRRFEAAVTEAGVPTYPEPVSHCHVCDWEPRCSARRRSDDHLSLVAGMRRSQRARLEDAGVTTAGELSRRVVPVPHLSEQSLVRLRTQAELQLAHRGDKSLGYRLIEAQAAGRGLAVLPQPSPGDLFFDIEGDNLVGEDGIEYLFGVLELVDGTEAYTSFWGHDQAAERAAFEAFIDFVMARLRRDPGLHVYHYAAYEPSRLKRLAGRHATREDDVDRLLRGRVLVDLYAAVRGALQASTESYSLKALEPFFAPAREERIRDASASVVEYERWLDDRDPSRLHDIEAYNLADCRSALRLRDWLESLRAEYARTFAEVLPRPEPAAIEPSEENARVAAETLALASELSADLPPVEERDASEQARALLAGLLDWHRREARPEWWEFFARLDMDEEDLRNDPAAIAGLTPLGAPRADGRSVRQRYAFDRDQESRFNPGDEAVDPRTGMPAGTVAEIDHAAGLLTLRRSAALQQRGHPRALVPRAPRRATELRRAVQRVAEWVTANRVDGPGPFRAGRDLLLRRPPRVTGHPEGQPLRTPAESAVDAACRVAAALDSSCLPIQGPPGSGKTHVAARVAVRLAAAGRRVGVTALTHHAISHLLGEICGAAGAGGTTLRLLQRAPQGQGLVHPAVTLAEPADIARSLTAGDVDIVAGTAWLFSREDMQGTLDTLIVDEASQVSLANVIAMCGAARNIVLCGDPQQLNQPTRGAHPPGAERSSLEHVLGAAHTIEPERGLFLDVTRRLHPALCRVVSEVFYDGRLRSANGCERQVISAPLAGLRGAGLFVLPVAHRGNSVRSLEESESVRSLVEALLQGTLTDALGESRRITASDIIVVAPYNAQVSLLSRALPPGVRAGTVDRFQGQEAAIAVYSLTTSSAADQRRGMEFLYSLNRLNVALSRAKAAAVLVCSPDLAHASCRSVSQLVLANALCRLLERATPAAPSTPVQHVLSFAGDLEILSGVHDEHRG